MVKENGFEQEFKVGNFFSRLGYFTRSHIQLYPREGKISDIDVFCIKFDNHLCPVRNIIETKRNSESASAIFQLHGLKSYYENCNAFFINKKVSPRTFKITSKLNIKVYSYNRLIKLLEKDLSYHTINLSSRDGQKLINYLQIIKRQINESLFWDYHSLWLENNHFQKLNKIQEMFKKTDDLFSEYNGSYPFLWFRKELFLMAFLAVMEISSKCIELNNNQINDYIEDQFYNLGSSKERKMQLKEGVDSILKILEGKMKEKIQLKLEIIPDWLTLLSKIVKIIISNAKFANNYLLANEQVLRAEIIGEPLNVVSFCGKLTQKILPSINSDLLKILHKEHILSDFNNYV